MKVKELAFNEEYGIYLNPGKVIDYSDGAKSEQYTFDSLKNAKDTSIFSMELFERIRDWSSEYHLTTFRANILRPLKIKKEHKVLEIGAGCGAITRYLGETGATITAVEGSLSRARCIAERCRDLENVTVVCSNVEDVEFEEKFDIITLIGVFEYTAKYSNRDNPFYTALKSYASLLKPDGSLVIAIENKLGLKYFSGYNEDHFAEAYFGLESRYGEKDITTFGHDEIEGMLKKSGFESTEFLYPFPDYKLPKVVITDSGLKNDDFNAADLIRFTKDRHYNPRPKANLLNEYLVWDSLAENGLIKDLSNSFLIVASKSTNQELLGQSLLAEYYTCNRFEPHNTRASFHILGEDKIRVRKSRLGNEPVAVGSGLSQHIQNESDYIIGANLHHIITGALFKRRFSEFEGYMVDWVNYLKSETLVHDSGAASLVRPEFFDALPFNIIVDENGKFNLFDQEWTTEEPFDITFLVVRYLAMHKRNKGLYRGYSSSYSGFVNRVLLKCGLQEISKSKLKKYEAQDKVIRNKVNRPGGLAPLQIKKSLVFLLLHKLKEIKKYLLYGVFAQR
ncbi:class I SAM-dependent methyltransferase [Flavobacteriaceae bacterium TP-CH-4]|uniref:Class I SAM-dependent methyltransferase n=1 Tax=Pelagihabitans pacificus TaxID=2696054 RepID=A0A967AS28_9FLAO|nr:class I SAM-dependent methyltransferase [Pelagihabitans pacificus]NHF59079.1 class I SAM-dependent methyltransferase [Pelagihabitans pacificus]